MNLMQTLGEKKIYFSLIFNIYISLIFNIYISLLYAEANNTMSKTYIQFFNYIKYIRFSN